MAPATTQKWEDRTDYSIEKINEYFFLDVPLHDQVNGHGGITTNYFTLYFGLVPESAVSSVWQQVVDFGLEKIGDYSAFVMLEALARFQISLQLEKIVVHINLHIHIAWIDC